MSDSTRHVPRRRPLRRSRIWQGEEITERILSLALEFLHEHQTGERKLVKA